MVAIPEVVEKVSWRLPLLVAASTTIALLLLFVFSPYSGFLCLFLIAPVVCLTFVVLLVVAAFRKRSHQFLSLFASLLVFLGISGALLKNEKILRDHGRWLLESRQLKAEVLSQPSADGEFKHMEWEATGFAGVANNTAYLVFDPADSLTAHSTGEFTGIPCKVPSVDRLEHHWYSVRFYTDEDWSDCPVTMAEIIDRYKAATCIPFSAKPSITPHTREWDTPLILRGGLRVIVSGADAVGGRIVVKYGYNDQINNRVEVAADAGDYVYPSDVRLNADNELLYVKASGVAGGISHETILFEYDLRGRRLVRRQRVANDGLPTECPEGKPSP
jgi:hypothetical protein